MIDPDNKHTCIKRPAILVITGFRALMLKQILEKRAETIFKKTEEESSGDENYEFKSKNKKSKKNGLDSETEKIIIQKKEKLDEIIDEVKNKGVKIDKFYDPKDGLNLTFIKQEITKLVGVVLFNSPKK